MSKIVVTGGQQRKRTLGIREWSQYEQGTAILLDANTGQLLNQHSYKSPAEYTPTQDKASVLFKSATVEGELLYVCTQTEVIIYQLPDFEQKAHISLSCFNDVHHVVPTRRNTLLVVSTGLDLVVELDMHGVILREWFTIESSNWSRFSKSVDYRQVLSTKPHHSHPNFVFEHGENVWVTRFEQKDAMCLTGSGRIDIGVERPHDGYVKGDFVYFTTIDGHIVEANIKQQRVLRTISLRPYFDKKKLLGWCRGLYPVDQDNFIVGFSRIRASKFHRNLIWAKKWLEQSDNIESMPTRIASINTAQGTINWEYDLEPFGLNAIFSVHVL